MWFSLSEFSPQMRKCILHLFTGVLKHLKKLAIPFILNIIPVKDALATTHIDRHLFPIVLSWLIENSYPVFWKANDFLNKSNTFRREASFSCVSPREAAQNSLPMNRVPPWRDQPRAAKPTCHPNPFIFALFTSLC